MANVTVPIKPAIATFSYTNIMIKCAIPYIFLHS